MMSMMSDFPFTIKFGTWNVQGCRNKMEEIKNKINVMEMDVVVTIM
jgi:hypothetical protein